MRPPSGGRRDAPRGSRASSDLATLLGAVTTTWATSEVEDPEQGGPLWTTTWGAITGILALLVAGVAEKADSVMGAIVSLAFDVASLIIDGFSFIVEKSALLVNIAMALIDGGAAGLDTYVLGLDVHWW